MNSFVNPCDVCCHATTMVAPDGKRYVLCDPQHWSSRRCARYLLEANEWPAGETPPAPVLPPVRRPVRASFFALSCAWLAKLWAAFL